MSLFDLIRSRKIFVCFLIILVFSLVLQLFPLVGSLGYEFSIIIAFLISFISVFTSAEILNDHSKSKFTRGGIQNLISTAIFVNLLILFGAFVVAFLSTWANNFCYLKDGVILFLLLPLISMIFSTVIGSVCGIVFGNRGFLIGSIVLVLILISGLYSFYHSPHIFIYNAVIGYFPGPIYDVVIPITKSLVFYRFFILAITILIFKLVGIYFDGNYFKFSFQNIFLILLLIGFVVFCFINKEKLGFNHSREYITSEFLTETVETDNFIIHYSPYSKFAQNIDLVVEDHEWQFGQLKNYLKVKSTNKIHSYIYPDVATRKKLIGAGNTTIADPINNEIHLIYNSFPHKILKHELVHVMSSEFGMDVLKISPKIGLIEGLAVAADWDIKGISRHQWSRSMLDSGTAPEIEDIVGYGFWYAPGTKAYTLMGSFCRFLIDTYGIEKFKVFYKTGKTKAYDMSLEQLVAEWKEFLYKVTITENTKKLAEYRFSDQGIFGESCPREVEAYKEKGLSAYKNNNLLLASDYFAKAKEKDTSDSDVDILLAYSNYYQKKYDDVLEISNNSGKFSKTEINILNNIRANIFWQNGDYPRALSIYKSLRTDSLPDDLLRELDIKISLENYDEYLKDGFKLYFSVNDSFKRASTLDDILSNFPYSAEAYYLKGRMHYNRKEYEQAATKFFYADNIGLPTKKLRVENLLLLGISHYTQKRYDLAIEVFEEIIMIDNNGNNLNYVYDLIERCKWSLN